MWNIDLSRTRTRAGQELILMNKDKYEKDGEKRGGKKGRRFYNHNCGDH